MPSTISWWLSLGCVALVGTGMVAETACLVMAILLPFAFDWFHGCCSIQFELLCICRGRVRNPPDQGCPCQPAPQGAAAPSTRRHRAAGRGIARLCGPGEDLPLPGGRRLRSSPGRSSGKVPGGSSAIRPRPAKERRRPARRCAEWRSRHGWRRADRRDTRRERAGGDSGREPYQRAGHHQAKSLQAPRAALRSRVAGRQQVAECGRQRARANRGRLLAGPRGCAQQKSPGLFERARGNQRQQEINGAVHLERQAAEETAGPDAGDRQGQPRARRGGAGKQNAAAGQRQQNAERRVGVEIAAVRAVRGRAARTTPRSRPRRRPAPGRRRRTTGPRAAGRRPRRSEKPARTARSQRP